MNKEIDGVRIIGAKEITRMVEKQFKLIARGHYVYVGVSSTMIDVLILKDGWSSDKESYLSEHIDFVFDSDNELEMKYIKTITAMEMLLRGIA